MACFKNFIEQQEKTTQLGGLEDLVICTKNINHVLKDILNAILKIDPFLYTRMHKSFSGTVDYISPEAIKYGTPDSDNVTDVCNVLSNVYPQISKKVHDLALSFQKFEEKFIFVAKMVQGISDHYYGENTNLTNKLLLSRIEELIDNVENLNDAMNMLRTEIDIKSVNLIGCQRQIISLLGNFDKFYSYFQKIMPDIANFLNKSYNSIAG